MQTLQNEWTINYFPKAGKQEEFHSDRYQILYRLISAGTGAGKTIAGVFEVLAWLLENPGIVGYIFEPTYIMVNRILIPVLEKLLGTPIEANPAIKKFSRYDKRIDLRNGSTLWFGSLEDPEKAEGPNIDFIHVDEARLIRHFDVAWRVIQRRLRGSVPGKYPSGAWVTTTPDAPGSVLHTFFENPKTKNARSKVYRWSIADNPYLPATYIEEIKRSHHGGLAERFVHGRFAAVGAGTIPFDAEIHVLSTIYFDTLKWICYGVDIGWTNPSCILAVAWDNDDRAYVIDEVYSRHLSPEAVMNEAFNMVQKWNKYGKGPFYVDPSAKSTIEWWKQKGLDARASEPKRDEGLSHMAGYFPLAGDKKPRIFISPVCVNLIAELQTYDETIKENDHAVDALRYALGCKMKKEGPVDAWVLG